MSYNSYLVQRDGAFAESSGVTSPLHLATSPFAASAKRQAEPGEVIGRATPGQSDLLGLVKPAGTFPLEEPSLPFLVILSRHVKTPSASGKTCTLLAPAVLCNSYFFLLLFAFLLFPKISLTSHLFIPFISVKESGRLLNPIMF